MIRLFTAALLVFISLTSVAQNLTTYRSPGGVDETSKALERVILDMRLLFIECAVYDQPASESGGKLSLTRSIAFDAPDLTTQLLLCQQTAAHDLPLKIIVWEEHGDVFIGFVDPQVMSRRFMLSGCEDTLEALSKLMIRISMNALRGL